eukprot:COSAG05_NODE_5954_length_1052_cov_1.253935_1_plen_205_part_00
MRRATPLGDDAIFDKRDQTGRSQWHWGAGIQYLPVGNIAELRAELSKHNGIPGLDTVEAGSEGYAERAAEIFHRDGFVCVTGVLAPTHTEALRRRTDDNMRAALADEHGGAKGAWRYMFSGGQKSGSCMHFDEYAQLADLRAVDDILQAIWQSRDFVCHSGGGDFCFPGTVASVGLLPIPALLPAALRCQLLAAYSSSLPPYRA